jgi:non-ribosomal peptide synthase protein (TIGR01720 family)
LTEGPRGALWTGAIFDVSVYEIFSTLLMGGAVCPVPEAIRLLPDALLDWLGRERITTAYLPPIVLAPLASRLEAVNDLSLARLLVGVEPIPAGLLYRMRAARPSLRIINGYGPTEATICATLHDITAEAPAYPNEPVSIGRAVSGSEVHVLDKAFRPVPIGMAGDLYIGGAGLSRGYLNAPGLTAERFIPHPLSIRPGARLYATGDRAKWRPDGTLAFLGRRDFQIKLRGLRIEPAEVEAALRRLPGVNRALVLHDKRANCLAAYVESVDTRVSASALREALADHLPQAMIPSVILVETALPTLPSGKIDRTALPPLPGLEATSRTPPQPGTESILAAIWADVLGRADIAREDNFFSLGGDSISAIQVASRIEAAGIAVTPGLLFRHQTLMGLAAALSGSSDVQTVTERFNGRAPLLPIQAWFFAQGIAQRNHWNQSVLLSCKERINPEVLTAAVAHLVERHEALRTTFCETEIGWMQVISDTAPTVPCDLVELGDERARRADCAALQASLDIGVGPLFRVDIQRLPEQDFLFLVAHHLIIDAQSWRILGKELSETYDAFLAGRVPEARGAVAGPSAWVNRLSRYAGRLSSDDMRRRREIGPIPSLPLDRKEGVNTADQEACFVSSVMGPALDAMTAIAKAEGIEAHLLCALGSVLTRWTGEERFVVDLERMGRPPLFRDLDITRSLGWFTVLAPVTLGTATGAAPRRAMAAAIRDLPEGGLGHVLASYLHADAAFPPVQRPEVSVNYFGRATTSQNTGPFQPSERATGPHRAASGVRPYLVEISAVWKPDAFEISWHYPSALLRESTIAQLAAGLIETLSADPTDRHVTDTIAASYDVTSILKELKLDP